MARRYSIFVYMRNSGVRYSDDPKKWVMVALDRLKHRKDFNDYIWKYQGGELYFRPKKMAKKWKKFFCEVNENEKIEL